MDENDWLYCDKELLRNFVLCTVQQSISQQFFKFYTAQINLQVEYCSHASWAVLKPILKFIDTLNLTDTLQILNKMYPL